LPAAQNYGPGSQAGGAGRCPTLRSRSGRIWLRCWTVLLPAVQRGHCSSVRMLLWRSRVSEVPRACALPVSGRPPPVSACLDSRYPPAASTGPLDQRRRANATCGALPWCRIGGCGSAAVLPQPAGQLDMAAGVWVAAEPDAVDAFAVRCCFRNRGRCPQGRARTVGVRRVGVRRGHCRSLRVSAATGTGRMPGGRWTRAAATAGTPGRVHSAAGRRAGRARRSWPAAPRPARPRRSAAQPQAHQLAGQVGCGRPPASSASTATPSRPPSGSGVSRRWSGGWAGSPAASSQTAPKPSAPLRWPSGWAASTPPPKRWGPPGRHCAKPSPAAGSGCQLPTPRRSASAPPTPPASAAAGHP
jgi:hypothetical protein